MSADFILLCDISKEQVLDILTNLDLPKLVAPFKCSRVSGRLLTHVESPQDLVDIDAVGVKPIFARALFAELSAWKTDGGRVPCRLLLTQTQTSSTSDTNTTTTTATLLGKRSAEEY